MEQKRNIRKHKIMDPAQEEKQRQILNDLIAQHDSLREFAREIGEDSSDVLRWRNGRPIHIRAAVKLVRKFSIEPHDIQPDIFEPGTKIVFKR